MKIEAIETIIEWDEGQMVIINAGETGELSDTKAAAAIEAGTAKAAKGKKAAAATEAPADEPPAEQAP